MNSGPCSRKSKLRFSLVWALMFGVAAPLAQPVDGKSNRSCSLDDLEQEMLDRVNQARSQPRQCGGESFDEAQPLTWNCRLEAAARAHTEAMVEQAFFGHTGPDGKQVTDRVDKAGYSWRSVGENIAAGQETVGQVVEGWLQSPGHCRNIMKPGFEEMGAARSDNRGGPYDPYWTQVFARPRQGARSPND